MKKYKDYLVGIIFAIIGIFMFSIFTIINIIDDNFKKDAIKTVGVIKDITYNYIGEDDDYDVIIDYKDINGINHTAKSDYYSATMKIGDKIIVYYKDNNYSRIVVEKNYYISYILYGLSGLFFTIGIILIIIPIIKNIKNNKLIKTGLRLNASITSVDLNARYQINGTSPYVIKVSFIYNNLVYEAKSNNIWYEVGAIVDNMGIKELPVYIDSNNPKNNYVDTRELEKYLGK